MVERIITEDELLAAVDVLERVSRLYNFDPQGTEWSPEMLRNELSHIKYNNAQEEIYAKVADPLVQLAMASSHLNPREITDQVFDILRKWEISPL